MHRREFLKLTSGAVILGIGYAAMERRTVWAQIGTSPADLGLPELTVTMAAPGFQVSPSEVPAGWTLVTFDNQLSPDNFNSADFTLVPAEMTPEEAISTFATPTANGAAPAWIYETLWAGGPLGVGGAANQAVVNLTEGTWLVWSAGETYPTATLTVMAADTAPTPPSITADVRVTMQEYAFVGLENPVPVGPHIWEVTATGKQPHLMILFKLPDGTTSEQLVNSFMGSEESPEDALDLSTIQPANGCAVLSTGQTAYVALDLAAGTYGAVCVVPEIETGAPHAVMGMAATFTVA